MKQCRQKVTKESRDQFFSHQHTALKWLETWKEIACFLRSATLPSHNTRSLLQEWKRETISHNLMTGIAILNSRLLRALKIYNLPKHRFVLHFLWGLLNIYIPILIEGRVSTAPGWVPCQPVMALFVYWRCVVPLRHVELLLSQMAW